MKDVQATGEAFSPQKRRTSSMKFLNFSTSIFSWDILALLDLDPTKINADPDSQMQYF